MKLFRKITAIFLCAIFCCMMPICAGAAGEDNDIIDDWDVEYTLGDLNNDTFVNTDDIILLRKYVAGLISKDDIIFPAGDLNNDEKVNTDDIVQIRKIVAGLA